MSYKVVTVYVDAQKRLIAVCRAPDGALTERELLAPATNLGYLYSCALDVARELEKVGFK